MSHNKIWVILRIYNLHKLLILLYCTCYDFRYIIFKVFVIFMRNFTKESRFFLAWLLWNLKYEVGKNDVLIWFLEFVGNLNFLCYIEKLTRMIWPKMIYLGMVVWFSWACNVRVNFWFYTSFWIDLYPILSWNSYAYS